LQTKVPTKQDLKAEEKRQKKIAQEEQRARKRKSSDGFSSKFALT
jgi:hypothetical protein